MLDASSEQMREENGCQCLIHFHQRISFDEKWAKLSRVKLAKPVLDNTHKMFRAQIVGEKMSFYPHNDLNEPALIAIRVGSWKVMAWDKLYLLW